jgi:hypothetical protein
MTQHRSPTPRLGSLRVLLSALLASSSALAEPAPPPPPPAPPLPPVQSSATLAPSEGPRIDVEVIRKLEQRVADLEANAAAEKRAAAEKAAAEKKAADEKGGAEARQKAEDDAEAKAHPVPFAFGDFTWVPGGYAPSESPLKWGPLTGEFRVDTVYHYDFSNPKDDTISGSSEVFRSNEIQVTQLGFGGDFLYKNVQARLMTQFGMYSTTTPRNDASPGKGQWDLADAYRYLSEAYGGYHIPVWSGINVQAGIFMSYVGLWSYYNFDNWTYQPSYVSSNTPWFFDGLRVQIFPSDKLKIEPWLVNGWQSYGKFNEAPGLGLQVLYRPNTWLSILGNQYFGTDTLGTPGRKRIHTDDSIMVKYFDHPDGAFTKAAFSVTLDAGCEFGSGDMTVGTSPVSCGGGTPSKTKNVSFAPNSGGSPDQFFLGFMAYHRVWYAGSKLATTIGGGAITNPGRYLVLLPPINGATAITGSPYFSENAGNPFEAWDMQITEDWYPREFIIIRAEYNHRAASVPYFTGHNGVTPPGGDTGTPDTLVMGWKPDLVDTEDRFTLAMMVRF